MWCLYVLCTSLLDITPAIIANMHFSMVIVPLHLMPSLANLKASADVRQEIADFKM